MLLGMDLSNGNPNADMNLAHRQGVSFCIAKCSQGWAGGPGGWMDWTWVDVASRARAASILPGGYHWMLRGNGAAQAHLFVQSLQRLGGPKGFLCAIDVEQTPWNQGLNVDPQTVDDFLAEWDRITGKQPILLYGASWYHDGYMHAGARWPNRPLWWAGYTGVGSGPITQAVQSVTPGFMYPFGGWTSYAIRQFTDNAQVGGELVDASVTYMPYSQLLAMTGPPSKPSPSGDDMTQAQYDVLLKTLQQLVTVVQGVPAGQPNPYALVGTRNLAHELDEVKADLAAIKAKVGA